MADALSRRLRSTLWAGGAVLLFGSVGVTCGIGVRQVEGDFSRRDAVRVLSLEGRELARGLSAMNSDELKERKGQRGLVVHRNHLVITPGASNT